MNGPVKPKSREKIRLVVADDHIVMRMGLVYAASEQPDMQIVAEVESGEDAVTAYRAQHPDVLILDLRMPGMDGLATIRAVRAEFPTARILIYSNYARSEQIYQALKTGASGFVVKSMNLNQLFDAIRSVHAGERYIPQELAVRMSERGFSPLSERETEVLTLIGKGRSNKEIAATLGVAEGTVKLHVTNIMMKLEVSARTEALVVAVQRGIIDIA